MEIQFTPDQVMEIGEVWGDVYLHNLPPEKLFSRYTPSQRVAGLKPEERVAGLKPEERVAGLKPEEVFSSYKPEEIEAYLKSIKRQNGA